MLDVKSLLKLKSIIISSLDANSNAKVKNWNYIPWKLFNSLAKQSSNAKPQGVRLSKIILSAEVNCKMEDYYD